MTLSNKILTNLLDKEQIEGLQTIFDTFKMQYLEDLDTDTFSNDYTDEEVKSALKIYLEGNMGVVIDKYDLDRLYDIIKDEFI